MDSNCPHRIGAVDGRLCRLLFALYRRSFVGKIESQPSVSRSGSAAGPDGLFPGSLLWVRASRIVGADPAVDGSLGSGDAGVELFESLLLPRRWRGEHGRRIAMFAIHSLFRHIVEVGEEPIEVGLRKRIVLMVVATGAGQRLAEHHRAEGRDTVHDILDAVFLVEDSVLPDDHVVAHEACRQLLIQ